MTIQIYSSKLCNYRSTIKKKRGTIDSFLFGGIKGEVERKRWGHRGPQTGDRAWEESNRTRRCLPSTRGEGGHSEQRKQLEQSTDSSKSMAFSCNSRKFIMA